MKYVDQIEQMLSSYLRERDIGNDIIKHYVTNVYNKIYHLTDKIEIKSITDYYIYINTLMYH